MSNYIHSLPIFLDATCSGVQHFAAMLLDKNLAELVNLISTKDKDQINDFYSTLVPSINKAINDSWMKDNGSFPVEFSEIKLSRKELKPIIMTKSYNVSEFGISRQLKENFEKVKKTIKNRKDEELIVYDYKVPAKNSEGYVILDIYKIDKLASLISKNIFVSYKSLQEIYNYLTQISKILISLGLPLSWATPDGLEITQHYNSSNIKKITLNILAKNRTAVLREWTNELDTRKQVQGIIPNIVHSMDAAHLMKVVSIWANTKQYIITVHDCFGTHPNHMDNLANVVRDEFINIYSANDFLQQLHDNFINTIKTYKIKIEQHKGIDSVRIKNKWFNIPNPPKKGELILKDIDGKYMIS